MVERERVAEVKNREHQTQELSNGNHERNCQRGALRGENIHATNAHVLRGYVAEKKRPQLGDEEVDIK